MLATHVLAPQDSGRWHLARLLQEQRSPDGWRCVVTYSSGPGMTYIRAMPASELRRADEQDYRASAVSIPPTTDRREIGRVGRTTPPGSRSSRR